jgi:ubiquinone/menaquinone biosynthesis C-methylase UbiE
MTPRELRVPVNLRRGGWRADEDASITSAVWLIEHMCSHLGLDDLGESEVMDFGCGVKFSQALINHQLPIKRYVGIDVERVMIAFLQQHVTDKRFEYHLVDVHNELYNPNGTVLSETTSLPIDGQTFDVICLFSVFTHLAPHDYRTMLRLLRRFAKPTGRLFFTLYIDEETDDGHGLIDSWHEFFRSLPPERLARYIEEHAETVGPVETFRDLDPTKPLKWAVYSERYARELIQSSGWKTIGLFPPGQYIQHHFVCTAE